MKNSNKHDYLPKSFKAYESKIYIFIFTKVMLSLI